MNVVGSSLRMSNESLLLISLLLTGLEQRWLKWWALLSIELLVMSTRADAGEDRTYVFSLLVYVWLASAMRYCQARVRVDWSAF